MPLMPMPVQHPTPKMNRQVSQRVPQIVHGFPQWMVSERSQTQRAHQHEERKQRQPLPYSRNSRELRYHRAA